MIALEGKNLYKSYISGKNKLEVLRGLDIRVEKGSLVSIMGESGTGKSTLLNILSTLDDADSGEIIINDKLYNSLTDKEINELRNHLFGFIFQFHYLLTELTVEENVAIPLLIRKTNFYDAINKARSALEKVKLYNKNKAYPNTLSGGEQQKVAVARALVHSPQIVFADEPSGNLDPKNSNNLHNIIKELNQTENQTFIIVTHDIHLGNICNEKYIMEDGILKKVNNYYGMESILQNKDMS